MSTFRPRVIEVIYDRSNTPIALDMTGETIEGTGVMTNAHLTHMLTGSDATNFATLIGNIKTAKGR
jgi:hypothetical protein